MLAIFDLDGTLLNTAEDLGNALNHTLRAHGLPVHGIPEYRMMVGDSGIDISTARNAGIKVIAVSWGFRPRADLENADVIADSAAELRNAILNNCTQEDLLRTASPH